jgi:hypothetical protein
VKDIHEGPLEAHRRGIDQETGLPFPALPEWICWTWYPVPIPICSEDRKNRPKLLSLQAVTGKEKKRELLEATMGECQS